MPQRLFKARAKKIAPKKPAAHETREVVLVGTYKDKQLAWIKKNGVYNYPVKDGDEFDAEAFAKIRELWLYAGSKGTRHCFEAFRAGGEFGSLADFLPTELAHVPRERLRVCEAAVQMEFYCSLGLPVKNEPVPFPNPEHPKFAFIDLFAGKGEMKWRLSA